MSRMSVCNHSTIPTTKKLADAIIETVKDSTIPVKVETFMLDYEYVNSCNDVSVLKDILLILISGREGRYPELEASVEKKIMSLLSENDRQMIMAIFTKESLVLLKEAEDSLLVWIDSFSNEMYEPESRSKSVLESNLLDEKDEDPLVLPPVRGAKEKVNSKSVIVTSSSSFIKHQLPKKDPYEQKNVERISKERLTNRDYFRAWDKFDVDEAEKSIDSETEADKEEEGDNRPAVIKKLVSDDAVNSEGTSQTLPIETIKGLQKKLRVDLLSKGERLFMAKKEKEIGNEDFKNKEYGTAFFHYSKSIALYEKDPVVFSNRALAGIRINNLDQARSDCDQAIAIDPSYMKALARRGSINHKCGRFFEALKDLSVCVNKESENKEFKELFMQVKDKIEEETHNLTKKRIVIVEDEEDSIGEASVDYHFPKNNDSAEEEIEEIFTPGASQEASYGR